MIVGEQLDRKLMTKQGYVARTVARRLIGMERGSRVPGVTELARDSGVGYGTVQEAMHLLEDIGAATFRRRGAQGTVLEEAHADSLWFVANVGHFVGSLPMPYSRRYEGLATGLHSLLKEAGIPVSLSYMRGGIRRLEALLKGGSNFAITSLFTARVFEEVYPGELLMVVELGPRSYVTEHQIILSNPAKSGIELGMKVGIDRDSADQARITEMELAALEGEVRLMPMTYTQVLRELEAGRLDAAVWNSEDVNGTAFKIVPLMSPEAQGLSGVNTVAAISVRADDEFSARVARSSLDRGRLLEVQRAVLEGSELPRY